MQRVKIGVTSSLIGAEQVSLDTGVAQHSRILEKLGAKPVILRKDMAPLSLIADFELAGLVFSGGGDIAAGSYGGDESLVRDDVDYRRDIFECALAEQAVEARLPTLATCRGMQLINVVFDGTLIEDLHDHLGQRYGIMHDQMNESGLPYRCYAHSVAVIEKTLLHQAVGVQRFLVNSMHHQAIDQLGTGLRAVAHAEDGVIEAIEFPKYSSFFIGVQWHPEWLPEDPVSQNLYTRLIKEAQRYQRQGFRDGTHGSRR